MRLKDNIKYADFLPRFIAFLIDGVIAYFPIEMLNNIFGLSIIFIIVFTIVFWWIYTSLMLSSSWKATLGKKFLHLRVLTLDIQRLTFQQASNRFLFSFVSYTFVLPILMIFFNDKKQTFHDYYAKTIVVDKTYDYATPLDDSIEYATPSNMMGFKIVQSQNKSWLLTILIIIFLIPFIIFFGYALTQASVLAYIGYNKSKAYDDSFYKTYIIQDYNDTNIIYYNSLLEKSTKEFIDAEDTYSKFAADTKKDLALNCIEHFAKKHSGYNWYRENTNYRNHARNKYANTEEKIEQAKANSKFIDHNFYTFDLNSVNHKVDEITRISKDTNRSLCDEKKSVQELYDLFIPLYIPDYEFRVMRTSPQNRNKEWYDILQTKHTDYFTQRENKQKLQEQREKKEYLKREEYIKNKKLIYNKKRYENSLKNGTNPLFSAIVYHQNDELDRLIETGHKIDVFDPYGGETPLSLASSYDNIYAMEVLLANGVNINLMNKNKYYNAFTRALSNRKVNMEIINIFLKYGVDVNYQYKRSETPLTQAAKGCDKLELVQLLLDNGADPDLIDTYEFTTRTGLFRYCPDKEKHKKMMQLLEKNDSFFKW